MRVRSSLLLTVAFVTMFAMILPASAMTDRIPITAEETLVTQIDPGVQWDSGKFNHLRGNTLEYAVVGTSPLYDGTNTVVVNWNLVFPTFEEGMMWGKFTVELDEYDGGYTGNWVADLTGDDRVWIGWGVGHGFGEVEGYKLFFDMASTGTGVLTTGYILTPGNK